MARAGERIVVGQVTAKTGRWGEGRKMIWTDYTVRVDETWKGEPAPTVVVSMAGGTVGRRSIQVTHVPALAVGGTYVLILNGNQHLYASPVVGTEQGLFREVNVEGETAALLLGAGDAVLALTPEGRLTAKERVTIDADGRHARRPQPAAARPNDGPPTRGLATPEFRDGDGRVVTPKPTRKLQGIQGAPAPLTRAALRDAVKAALAAEVTR